MASLRSTSALLVGLLVACFVCTAAARFANDLASVVDVAVSSEEWTYSEGENGPANWGGQCTTGEMQSPIDINPDWIHGDKWVDIPAKIYYHPAPAFVYGDGKTLEVQWAGGVFNVRYLDHVLEKLMIHTPSEHTYSGKRFPLEIQFYHFCPEGITAIIPEQVAITSLMFEEGDHNDWLEQIIPALPTKDSLGRVSVVPELNAIGINGSDLDWTRYFRYTGSETTPPCNEVPGVVWSLLEAPLSASKRQIERIQDSLLTKSNARPIPPMAARYIYYPDDSLINN